MKNLRIIAGLAALGFWAAGCNAGGENPGRVYMPDMAYSRAYEAYGYNNVDDYEHLLEKGVNYRSLPVPGTVARGEAMAYTLPDTDSGYQMAINYKSPMDTVTLSTTQMKEAERIYLVNCAICHGTALDGNGPLWKNGDGPFPAAPRNLVEDYAKKLADGQMYHVITYGKGLMGSYASQVHPQQRWWIIKYIRSRQAGSSSGSTDSTATAEGNTSGAATTGGSATVHTMK